MKMVTYGFVYCFILFYVGERGGERHVSSFSSFLPFITWLSCLSLNRPDNCVAFIASFQVFALLRANCQAS